MVALWSATSLPSSPTIPSSSSPPSGAVAAVLSIEGVVAAVSPIMLESPEHREGSPWATKASEGLTTGALAETLSACGAVDEVDVGSVVVACRTPEEIMDSSGARGALVGGCTGVAECERREHDDEAGIEIQAPGATEKLLGGSSLHSEKTGGFHVILQPSKTCSQARRAKWVDSARASSWVVSVSSPLANARSLSQSQSVAPAPAQHEHRDSVLRAYEALVKVEMLHPGVPGILQSKVHWQNADSPVKCRRR